MSDLLPLVHDGALAAGAGVLLFAGTVSFTALVAVLAPSEPRRRAAREVLTILLRRRPGTAR